MEFYKEILKLI